MTSKSISIAIFHGHYEIATIEDGEIVGDSTWAFTAEQVANAVKALLEAPAPVEPAPAEPRRKMFKAEWDNRTAQRRRANEAMQADDDISGDE